MQLSLSVVLFPIFGRDNGIKEIYLYSEKNSRMNILINDTDSWLHVKEVMGEVETAKLERVSLN